MRKRSNLHLRRNMAWTVRMAWPIGPRHTGNPGRSARVKVDPGRLVGDRDRSGCDMFHDSQEEN